MNDNIANFTQPIPRIGTDQTDQAPKELPCAIEQAKAAKAEKEKSEAKVADCHAKKQELAEAAEFWRNQDLGSDPRECLNSLIDEAIALQDAYDLTGQAQHWRVELDKAALRSRIYAQIIEYRIPLANIAELEATVSLYRADAAELDALALVSHLRTVAALGNAVAEEGTIHITGERTRELQRGAVEANQRADATEAALRDARAQFDRIQAARIARGPITNESVSSAIARY